MGYTNLMFKDSNELIGGIELPKSIILSLEYRGKRNCNFRFNNITRLLEVRCSKCNSWFSVYELKDNGWVDINDGAYWVSRKETTNELYFGSKCSHCHRLVKEDKTKEETQKKDTCNSDSVNDISKKNVNNNVQNKKDRVQQTISLSKENDKFLRIYPIAVGQRKNDFINSLLDSFRLSIDGPIIIK